MNNSKLKLTLFFATIFKVSFSFAECNTDPELKLIKFVPSGLSAYVPHDTVVNKEVNEGPEDYDVRYKVLYKEKEINLLTGHDDFPYYKPLSYETIDLTNINDKAELIKVSCGDGNKTCATAHFGSDNLISKRYTSVIRYSLPLRDTYIGDEFMMSLFLTDKDGECAAVEADSYTYNGPFFAYVSFDNNDSTIANEYYDNKKPITDKYYGKADQLNYFAHFVNRENIKIKIEGHADKMEVGSSNDFDDYSLALSKQRAESVRTLLIKEYGVNPENIIEVKGQGSSQPVVLSDTEEGQRQNARVRISVPPW